MSYRSQHQDQPLAADHPQCIDPRLLTLMNDDRYFGDLSSQASPFSSGGIPSDPHAAQVTHTPVLNHRSTELTYQGIPHNEQANASAPTPTSSSVYPLTSPNIAQTPQTTVQNTTQSACYPRQRQPTAVRTRPSNQQFRSAPYGYRIPQSAAATGRAPQRFLSNPASHSPSAVPQRRRTQPYNALPASHTAPPSASLNATVSAPYSTAFSNDYLASPATTFGSNAGGAFAAHSAQLQNQYLNPYAYHAVVPTGFENYQLNQYNHIAATPTGFDNYQPNLNAQNAGLPTGINNYLLNSYYQNAAFLPASNNYQLTPAAAGIPSAPVPIAANSLQSTPYQPYISAAAAPSTSGNQQLNFQPSRTSSAAPYNSPLFQQLGSYVARSPHIPPVVHPAVQQQLNSNSEGNDSEVVGLVQVNQGTEKTGPYLSVFPLPAQPQPQTPSRTDSVSTGIPTPKTTPSTDKLQQDSAEVASKAPSPAIPLEDQPGPGAVDATAPSSLPARACSPIDIIEQSQLESMTLAELEAELMKRLPLEIEKLDKQALFNEHSEGTVGTAGVDDVYKTRRDSVEPQVEMTHQFDQGPQTGTANQVLINGKLHNAVSTSWVGKANARKDLCSDVYHAYTDQGGFIYLDICLTRVDLAKNTNERVLLSIYETDFLPCSYTTFVRTIGPGDASSSEIVANSTDFFSAFREFRKAFKKYTRISWEARATAQEYIDNSAAVWEKQQFDRAIFDKVGELSWDDSGFWSPGPKRDGPSRASSKGKTARPRPEDILTEDELDRCRVRRFKYVPPAIGLPQGVWPILPDGCLDIPGDDPKDGGWTFVIQ